VRVSVLDLPGLPPTDGTPSLSGGVPLGEVVTLLPRERVVGLVSLAADAPTLALATVQGTVKRVMSGDVPGNRDAWEAISLKDGDEVVGAVAAGDTDELVLLSSDASLLHFPASAVRPQGRSAGGMAGIKLASGQRVVAFGTVPADRGAEAVVVTVAGASGALPGTQAGSAKVTPFEVYPGKGRATGGVRAHRFLRNEDALLLGWVGPAPAWATGSAGQPIELPPVDPRRDMSGTALSAPVHAIG
jgi:DNA gyrase subunit A